MSVSSKADAEGGKWSAWVAAVVAQRDSEVDWPSSAERADDEVAQAGVLGGPNALRAARGARSRTRHGYRVITVNGRQVLEHRYVMEHHLGRPLRKGETVHHRDGNRSRNTIDNLELWTGAQPSGQRAADLLAWAEEIVARYGPERHLL